MTLPLQRQFYDNHSVYSPSGELMFRCSEKRQNWYLERNIAEIWQDGIKLTFEPNGLGCAGDPFYLQEMINRCVVCGTTSNLSRRFIIPIMLRRFFPDSLKNSSHHDIVLACGICHDAYESHARNIVKELCQIHSVAEGGFVLDPREHKIRQRALGAARALLDHSDKIPEARKVVLRRQILDAYPGVDCSKRYTLEWAAKAFVRPDVQTSGKLLLAKFKGDVGRILRHIVFPFRAMFVAEMKPGFMPEHWSITRKER